MNDEILRAAEARAQGTAQRGDRPRQRRASAEGGVATARGQLAGVRFERAAGDGGALTFTGHASVTEHAYELWDWAGPYMEVVSASAFDGTLAQDGLDVPLVLDHDTMRRIARTTNGTLRLSMDETGLLVDADLDPTDADVQYIEPKLRSGLIDEMSFRFRITRGQWSPDYTEYRIEEVDLHRGDVAIVGYGANPATDGGLRSRQDRADVEGVHPVTPRQNALYAAYEGVVETFGKFDQGSGPDGAHYMPASPFTGEGMACANCVMFEGPRACEVVDGDIAPEGVCKLWVIPSDLMAGATSSASARGGLLAARLSLAIARA